MKKQILSESSFLTNFAMQFIFLILLTVSNILPQVIIDERVEINPDHQSVGTDYMNLNNSSLVMLKTGLLKVYYSFVKHYNVELPDYSLLKVKFLKNDVTISDSVKPRFQNYAWWTDYMYNHCLQQYEWREGYNYVIGPYVELGSVVEGDTVQFIFYTDNVETQQPIEYDIYSATQGGLSWSVKLGNYNNCLLDFDNVLQIYLYVYDEVETIYADIDPGVLYPGDSAQVVIKRRLPGGILEDYPPEQTFEVGMLEGCMLGNLLVDDSLDTYFYDVSQPIKFIADTTGDSSGVVLLSIGLIDTSVTNKSNKISDALTQYCFDGEPINEYVTTSAEVKEEPTILLGETKYYQAKYSNPLSDKLIIEEVQVDENGIPHLNGGLAQDVWGDNPVSVVDTCDNCGQRMGVYWEKIYPTNEFENVPIVVKGKTYYHSIIKMNSLQSGLIRLVGRYWDKDSTYLVTLKAKRENGDSGQIQIRVVKPSLLKKGQLSSFEKAKDVLNNTVNIDSLCILYGGMYGIPPQLIKGQMYTESARTYFSSLSDSGFAPSYRFEPFTTQYEPNYKTDPKYNSYYIYDSTYTFTNMPAHYNVQLINYPSQIYTVWDMVENYSKLVNPNPAVNYYGGRNSTTHRVWLGYTVVDTIYTRIANEFAELYPELTNVQKYDSTNNKMIHFLQYEWTKNDAPKGTRNNIAQTRVASSYGLAQFLYGTARGIGYPKEDVPENINLMNYVYLFYKTQKKYLRDGLGINVESSHNWSEGYERSFCKWIYDSKWNLYDLVYSKKIINNSKRFFPQ